jgi:Ca-activated chloride channel family protein
LLERSAWAQFASTVNLVEVYATVTSRDGEPVTDLTTADFRVREDGEPQPITAFSAGDFPLSIAVALDRSFSMAGERLDLAKQAARAFLAALRPDDEVMVLAMGSEVQTISPLVPARLADAVRWDAIDAWGTTPLYDAIVRALKAIAPRQGRRALILISDGVDRYSETSPGELIDTARTAGVLAYPIAIGASRASALVELAAVTGGRSFVLKRASELRGTVDTLARELRFQYLLGYTPGRPPGPAPAWHAIDVQVDRPGVHVRARDGYLSK